VHGAVYFPLLCFVFQWRADESCTAGKQVMTDSAGHACCMDVCTVAAQGRPAGRVRRHHHWMLTETAPLRPCAVRVVPSSGSTAMSTFGALRVR
jgi:hypothetical protein